MVTIRINENSEQAKKMLEYLKTLPFVEVVNDGDESTYDPKFVAKIKSREKSLNSKKLVRVNPDDLWGSI